MDIVLSTQGRDLTEDDLPFIRRLRQEHPDWFRRRQCPCCGGSNITDHQAHQNYVLDIVIRPDVTCYHSQSGHCIDCNKRVQSCAPGQVSLAKGAARCRLGLRLALPTS